MIIGRILLISSMITENTKLNKKRGNIELSWLSMLGDS